MDETLRDLDRAVKEGREPLWRLQDAYARIGRGWSGELMPSAVYLKNSPPMRGVYDFCVDLTDPSEKTIELVYVPEGEIVCLRCLGKGHHDEPGEDGRGTGTPQVNCRDGCKKGMKKIRPLYVSRFPILWSQYLQYCERVHRARPNCPPFPDSGMMWGNATDEWYEEMYRHPAVGMSYEDAKDYCDWLGLIRGTDGPRLLTGAEWFYVAYGPPDRCKRCFGRGYRREAFGSDKDVHTVCPSCREAGKTHQRYPWGELPIDTGRMVWSQHPLIGKVETGACLSPSGEPTRDRGQSWCGAQDMLGNVFHWTTAHNARGTETYGRAMGCSYGHNPDRLGVQQVPTSYSLEGCAPNEIGFRMALNA